MATKCKASFKKTRRSYHCHLPGTERKMEKRIAKSLNAYKKESGLNLSAKDEEVLDEFIVDFFCGGCGEHSGNYFFTNE